MLSFSNGLKNRINVGLLLTNRLAMAFFYFYQLSKIGLTTENLPVLFEAYGQSPACQCQLYQVQIDHECNNHIDG